LRQVRIAPRVRGVGVLAGRDRFEQLTQGEKPLDSVLVPFRGIDGERYLTPGYIFFDIAEIRAELFVER
jgi:hypothetical protein